LNAKVEKFKKSREFRTNNASLIKVKITTIYCCINLNNVPTFRSLKELEDCLSNPEPYRRWNAQRF
ncbi:unnamed protein product, partial [Trichobilharzia szidati]